MEQQFDAQMMMTRVNQVAKELRKSEAYPAILGGVAGGIAGAVMAVLIAGMLTRRSDASKSTDGGASQVSGRPPFSLREVAQLATVLAPLAKQAQSWLQEQKKTAK